MNRKNTARGYLDGDVPLPGLDDPEGRRIPEGFEKVIDTHVHLFPDKLFSAVRGWFDEFGWPVRYRHSSEELLTFLFDRGVDHIVALQYAHKPGISRRLNTYMARMVKAFQGRVTGMATIFPGEEGADEILVQAFDSGLKGVKLHVHVQCFDLESHDMDLIYSVCVNRQMPMIIHAGREPKSPSYACDPYVLCRWEKVAEILETYPELRLCIPHLGMDEFESYNALAWRYDNLWLDTAVALTDYLPLNNPVPLASMRRDRIMYGSDFPNIPYAWDRELKWLCRADLDRDFLEKILWKNAAGFFNIQNR